MTECKKLLSVIKRSLGGILPHHMLGRIAERIADALIAEGIMVRKEDKRK